LCPRSYFTEENPAGSSSWLLMSCQSGPSFSVSATVASHSGSPRNAAHSFWRSEHVGELLGSSRRSASSQIRPGGCRASPRSAASRSRTATAAPACGPPRSGRRVIRRSWPFASSCMDGSPRPTPPPRRMARSTMACAKACGAFWRRCARRPGDQPVTVCSHRSGLRPASFRRRCSRASPANRDILGGPPRQGAAPPRAPSPAGSRRGEPRG
jgi:hypothetical protein